MLKVYVAGPYTKGNVEYIGNKAPKLYSELLTKGYAY